MIQNLLLLILFVTCFLCNLPEARSQQNNKVETIKSAFEEMMIQGKRERLPELEEEVMTIIKTGKEFPAKELAVLHTLAGSIKRELFKFEEAMPLLITAFDMCKREHGKNSVEALEAKKYLSWCYGDLGNTNLEYKHYYELLDYYNSDKKKYAMQIADQYNTIGSSYGSRGDKISEQYYLNQGKKIIDNYRPEDEKKERNKVSNQINIYNSLSISYYQSNSFYNAQMYARKCLLLCQIAMPESQERAINLMTIGRSLFQTENDFDSTLLYLNKAINLLEQKNGRGLSIKGLPPWATYKLGTHVSEYCRKYFHNVHDSHVC